jgi:hypothetical protein
LLPVRLLLLRGTPTIEFLALDVLGGSTRPVDEGLARLPASRGNWTVSSQGPLRSGYLLPTIHQQLAEALGLVVSSLVVSSLVASSLGASSLVASGLVRLVFDKIIVIAVIDNRSIQSIILVFVQTPPEV